MKNELKIFFTALMFYTRIPCPRWVDHSPVYLEKSTRYFPFIGLIVGTVSAFVYYISQMYLPNSISIILSMLASLLTTGAFHEDGLADVCDGFGGGWTKEKILEIMKDSRIGTYGVVGLVIVLLLKFMSSVELSNFSIKYFIATLLLGHVLSRLSAATMIVLYDYVRKDPTSKTKPLVRKLNTIDYLVTFVFGIAPLVLVSYIWSFYLFFILTPLLVTVLYLGRYFNKWIGGFTGDCLGSVQQLSEIVIYIFMIIAWRFI